MYAYVMFDFNDSIEYSLLPLLTQWEPVKLLGIFDDPIIGVSYKIQFNDMEILHTEEMYLRKV